jgi:2-phosphosulfolactate phosphatase
MTPAELPPGELDGRTVVVIDVLRATSSIVEALASGARSIYPVASVEDALRLAQALGRDDVLLCGERKCLPIDGFDLGNSPREFTPEKVSSKTLVMSTTNGTAAVSTAAAADRVLIASFLNIGAVAEELARSDQPPIILCAGRERQFALEDAVCAGELVRRLLEDGAHDWVLNDGALAARELTRRFGVDAEMFAITAAGQLIVDAGLGEDLAFCARHDRHSVVPVLRDRHLMLAPAA